MSLSQPSGPWSQTNGYDALWRVTSVVSPAGTFGYGYGVPSTASALIKTITVPNGAAITNGYDSLARLTRTALNNSSGQTLDAYSYLYDPLGLRTNVTRNLGSAISTATAGYDAIGQLTGWTAKETNTVRLNEQLGWAYDAAHNLHLRTNGGLIQTFTVDTANQLTNVTRTGTLTVAGNTLSNATSVRVNGQAAQAYADNTFASSSGFTLNNGQNTFTTIAQNASGKMVTNSSTSYLPSANTLLYDNNGNLTNSGGASSASPTIYAYDNENQLTNVMVPGQWRAAYVYDGLGRRRIARDYTWQSGNWVPTNEVHYVYDGMVPVQERDMNNNPLVTYTRGIDLGGDLWSAGGIGGLLARTDGNGSTFYHSDGVGNITALMNGSQNIVARYLYNPYGKLIGEWGGMADANKYRFSSKELDPLSGMYYYGFRFYDPNLQRWPNQDPIGERGGLNLYSYVNNDPVDQIDEFGLCWHQPWTWDWDELGSAFEGKVGVSLGLKAKGHLGPVEGSVGADYGMGGWSNAGGEQYGAAGAYVEGSAGIYIKAWKAKGGLAKNYELKIIQRRGDDCPSSYKEKSESVVGLKFHDVGADSSDWTKIGGDATLLVVKGGASVDLKKMWDAMKKCKCK
jgi:RHS repeat-associated protein